MTIELFKRERDMWNYSVFGLYLPDLMWGREEWDFGETERHYGVSFPTRISRVTTDFFVRYDFRLLGFGFYFVRQSGY